MGISSYRSSVVARPRWRVAALAVLVSLVAGAWAMAAQPVADPAARLAEMLATGREAAR